MSKEISHHCPCCGSPSMEDPQKPSVCPYYNKRFVRGAPPEDFHHVCDCDTKRWEDEDLKKPA